MASQTSFSESDSDGGGALQSLDKLETRIKDAVSRLGEADQRRTAAEGEAQRVQALFTEKESEIEQLRSEIEELRMERDEVRKRIEALVGSIDNLSA